MHSRKKEAIGQGNRRQLEREGYCLVNIGALSESELVAVAAELGTPMEAFTGIVTRVEPVSGSPYTTLTTDAVPFHNESVYTDCPPRYLILFCEEPGRGGETLLVRGDLIVLRLEASIRRRLRRLPVRSAAGGLSTVRPLIIRHPKSGEAVLFYLDPSLSESCSLTVQGEPLPSEILSAIRRELADPTLIHVHRWRRNDLLILDNYRVLHARRAFSGKRCLRRVLVA